MADTYQQRMEKGLPAEVETIAPLDAPMLEQTDMAQEQAEIEPTQNEVAQAAPQPESDKEINLRILRERSERAEKERDEAVRYMRDMQAQMNQRNAPPVEQEDDEPEYTLSEDALVEGKHLAAYNKKIRRLEEQINSYQQYNNSVTTETRLKAQYPDFDRVVSKENVEALKAQYPELAHSLSANPDLYTKAVSTYTLMKKLNIAVDEVTMADRERAQKNAAKPRPLVSVSPQQGDSPLARANAFAEGLTPDLQKQLLKEMELARRAL